MTFSLQEFQESEDSVLDRLPRLWERYAGFALTETQLHFVEKTLELQDAGGMGVLEGPAGTGKSSVTAAIIVATVMEGRTVAVAAPTHKAVNVLEQMVSPWRDRLGLELPEPRTLHSLLSLQPKKVPPGQPETFYQKRTPDLTGYDILIVDECSMIGRQLHEFVVEAVKRCGVTLLYVGDPCQLQPVNEYRLSPSFDMPFKMRLTDVLRHDGAVLNLATRARKMRNPQILPASGGGTTVFTYPSAADLEQAWMERLLADGPESAVMLAWTNKNRRRFNRTAREVLYGPDVPDFQAGDQVVTLAPVEQDGQMVLPNNFTLTVKTATLKEAYRPVPELDYQYPTWELVIDESTRIYVLTEAAEKQHKEDVAALGKEISAVVEKAKARVEELTPEVEAWQQSFGGAAGSQRELSAARTELQNAKDRWAMQYFPLKHAFAQVDFGYAVTIHKSQGSTYPVVYICDDYRNAHREQQQLLYVAVTRAAKEVHHLHVGINRPGAS